MADVYLAEQFSLNRRVAVKVLRPATLLHAEAVDRFAQEARAAAALIHGNIVQIHEVGCIEGVHFLAEEFVAGPSLRAWLKEQGPLGAEAVLSLLMQVAAALECAESGGVVHRDIKPENLLVTPRGEVKVADFGLARVLHDNLELTQTGMALGTPLYMSPEQSHGGKVDIRGDLYSLGATAYHLVTGQPPFRGTTGVAVALAHAKEPLELLRTVRPDFPVEVAGVIERLLEKDKESRFQTSSELLEAVEPLVAQATSSSRATALPLAWNPETSFGQKFSKDRLAKSTFSTSRINAEINPPAGTVASATAMLKASLDREEIDRIVSRRVWAVTGALAAFGLGVGFLLGRARSFRTGRRPPPRPPSRPRPNAE
jgi:serine/threonine-protein kinase